MADVEKIKSTKTGETYDIADAYLRKKIETMEEEIEGKISRSGGTMTGPLTTKDVLIQGLEQFGSVYARKAIGTLAAGTKYADLASTYKDGTWHRMWRLRFPAGANYWGKITVHLYGGYSSFNASDWMSKTITCNFNGASLYNNVGYYHNLGINVENDFRISEAIWNSTDSVWEILIWQKNLNGNNSPYVVLEAWASSSTQLESAKGITATAVELTQDTTYTAQKASPTGGDKPVTWADKPVFETPLGEKIGTAVNGVYFINGTGTTAGTWLGSHNDITKYYNGLMIAYKVGIAGVSGGTTLNINGLGAVSVVRNATTAVTTNYPVNSILFLVYTVDDSKAYWKIADYDANNYAYVRQYHTTNDANYPLLFKYDAGITDTTSYVTKYTRTANNLYFNPSTGTLYATRFSGAIEGLEEAVEEALTEAKESGDFKGEQGIQGYSIVATVDRPAFTESQWSTYGTIGRNENWGNTSNSGVRVGDLFIVVGTSTDAGKGHMLVYRYTGANNSTTLYGTCIGHHIISAKGATGPTGATGAEGLGIWRSSADPANTATSIALSTITIPSGRSVKVGDLIIANSTYSYMFRVTAVGSTAATVTYICSLRGATGPSGWGNDGASAVITGVSASIDDNVGTPSVIVTMGGTEIERSFNFAFKNLKGATGASSEWYTGTGITGTSTTATVFSSSGVSSATVGDMYLNTSTSNVYRCTTAGAPSAAKWVYVCNIKGKDGTASEVATPTVNGLMSSDDKAKLDYFDIDLSKKRMKFGNSFKFAPVTNYTNGWLIYLGAHSAAIHYMIKLTGYYYDYTGYKPINSMFSFYHNNSTFYAKANTVIHCGHNLGSVYVIYSDGGEGTYLSNGIWAYVPSLGGNPSVMEVEVMAVSHYYGANIESYADPYILNQSVTDFTNMTYITITP